MHFPGDAMLRVIQGTIRSSNRRHFRIALGLVLVCGVVGAAGCGGPRLPDLVPVKGKVLVDDAPVTAGQISFMPVSVDPSKPVPPSAGQIDSSGNYEIFTGGKAGAPAGKYKVTISPAMMPMEGAKGPPKTAYSEKYRDFKQTPLQVEVPSNSYDLKLTK